MKVVNFVENAMIMASTERFRQPLPVSAVPILAVRNVTDTVSYWHNILGFPNHWTWGEPPDHGGVSWHTASVQFSLHPKLAETSLGNCLAVNVKHVESLYALHQKNGVAIVAPLENKPWGMMEYMVQDINGYYIRFGMPGARHDQRGEKGQVPFRTVLRAPTPAEHGHLVAAVGWQSPENPAPIIQMLQSAVFAVVAEEVSSGDVVGCALLFGDRVSFYYVKDVVVHPRWQGMGVGTRLMETLTEWLELHAPENATVGLFTGEHLAAFYGQFGFTQACGMYRTIQRNKQSF